MNHVFLPGHRLMVQVQSSWFPLYDRNPQTFVENIFWAKPADYRKATQRVYHAPGQASFIELPVVKPSLSSSDGSGAGSRERPGRKGEGVCGTGTLPARPALAAMTMHIVF